MDVGLVYFANPPWPEMEAYPALYREGDELDKVLVFVGQGSPGDGLAGIGDDPGGTLRSATNTVEYADEALIGFTFNHPLERLVTLREGISGPGDSGGPALMCEMLMLDVNGRLACSGQQTVLGVSSHQASDDVPFEEGVYGVTERYARVSTHAPWIDATMETGHAGSCLAGSWVPETSSTADDAEAVGGGCSGGGEQGTPPLLWLLIGFVLLCGRREGASRRATCRP